MIGTAAPVNCGDTTVYRIGRERRPHGKGVIAAPQENIGDLHPMIGDAAVERADVGGGGRAEVEREARAHVESIDIHELGCVDFAGVNLVNGSQSVGMRSNGLPPGVVRKAAIVVYVQHVDLLILIANNAQHGQGHVGLGWKHNADLDRAVLVGDHAPFNDQRAQDGRRRMRLERIALDGLHADVRLCIRVDIDFDRERDIPVRGVEGDRRQSRIRGCGEPAERVAVARRDDRLAVGHDAHDHGRYRSLGELQRVGVGLLRGDDC